MKRVLLFLATVLLLGSCAEKLTEKVERSFPDGKPQLVRYYDKNNQCLKEEWKAYLRDGRPWSIDTFKNGELEGPSTVYWENGNLRWEGNYKAGVHCGYWRFYDEQGNFVRDREYGPCE